MSLQNNFPLNLTRMKIKCKNCSKSFYCDFFYIKKFVIIGWGAFRNLGKFSSYFLSQDFLIGIQNVDLLTLMAYYVASFE